MVTLGQILKVQRFTSKSIKNETTPLIFTKVDSNFVLVSYRDNYKVSWKVIVRRLIETCGG